MVAYPRRREPLATPSVLSWKHNEWFRRETAVRETPELLHKPVVERFSGENMRQESIKLSTGRTSEIVTRGASADLKE
jgi:hypothetical protein